MVFQSALDWWPDLIEFTEMKFDKTFISINALSRFY